MARTIKEIANGMKASFVQNSKLMEAYGLEYTGERDDDALAFYAANISTVSVESVLINIVAACVAVVENLMDFHKKEIDTAIARERYGHAGWYEKMALKFRYGENLSVNYSEEPDDKADDGNFAESVEYVDGDLTADEIEELQIVKYAYCEDDEDGSGVLLKVAGESGGTFSPLEQAEEEAFAAYMKRIKPAGIPLAIVNQGPEALALGLEIFYNPLVLNRDGELINGGEKPVEMAVQGYLNSLGFNGEFTVQALVDALQNAEGVEVVGFNYAKANCVAFDHRHTPFSGYMSIDFEDCEIEYTPNVKVQY